MKTKVQTVLVQFGMDFGGGPSRGRRQAESLEFRFHRFHRDNPHVYRRLVELAREAQAKGHARYSIDGLFHVLRWEQPITTDTSEVFRLNNDYRSLYARLIMKQEPDLASFFETRELKAVQKVAA